MINLSLEWQRKIYDSFMLSHFWLDYIVMDNDGIKKKFLRSNVPHDGGMLDRHVGHVGPHPLVWEKFKKKKVY